MCKKEEVEKLAVIRQREIELGLVKPVKAEELFGDKCKKREMKKKPPLTPEQLELRQHKIELMKKLAAIREEMKKGERDD